MGSLAPEKKGKDKRKEKNASGYICHRRADIFSPRSHFSRAFISLVTFPYKCDFGLINRCVCAAIKRMGAIIMSPTSFISYVVTILYGA